MVEFIGEIPEDRLKELVEIREAMFHVAPKLINITADKEGRIELKDRRLVLVNYKVFGNVVEVTKKMVGPGIAKKFFYDFGFNAARDIVKMFKSSSSPLLALKGVFSGVDTKTLSKLKANDPLEIILKIFGYGKYAGWIGNAEVTHISTEPPFVRVVMENTFESAYYVDAGRRSDEPVCHFLAGVTAGVYSSLYEKEVIARETKCRAKGDKYCEFIVTSPDTPM